MITYRVYKIQENKYLASINEFINKKKKNLFISSLIYGDKHNILPFTRRVR